MAEVVVEQGAEAQGSTGGAFGDVQGIFNWIGQYWWVILIVFLILVGIGLLIYFIYIWDRNQKRKDPMYVHWERTVEACGLNGRKDWIKKKRRWWMMVFGLFTSPIFGLAYLYIFLGEHWLLFWTWVVLGIIMWLPIAFFWYKDISMRIINVDKVTVGWYRGHCKRQDGFVYVLISVGKKWVIFDDTLVMRLPADVLTFKTVAKKNKEGDVENKLKFDKIEIDSYNWNERDNYIFIPMTTLVKEASYFYDPTLIEGGKIIDLRQKTAMSYHLITQVQMAEQTYSQLGKVTNNAVDSNVGVVAEKKKPEKQRDVNTGDAST